MRPTRFCFQRFDRLGDGEIGLAGAGRPQRQHHRALVDGVDQLLLQRAHRPDVFYIFAVARRRRVVAGSSRRGRKEGMNILGFVIMVAGLATRGTLGHGYSLVKDTERVDVECVRMVCGRCAALVGIWLIRQSANLHLIRPLGSQLSEP